MLRRIEFLDSEGSNHASKDADDGEKHWQVCKADQRKDRCESQGVDNTCNARCNGEKQV